MEGCSTIQESARILLYAAPSSGDVSECVLFQNVHLHRFALHAVGLHRFDRLRLVDGLKESLCVRRLHAERDVVTRYRELDRSPQLVRIEDISVRAETCLP